MTKSSDLQESLARLRKEGVVLPKSQLGAFGEAQNMQAALENRSLTSSMRKTGSNIQIALPKIREPMSSLSDKGIPYDYTDSDELKDIRRWARLFYATHDLVPLLVDIYAKFPTAGMSLECKDPKIKEFYEEMFFNQLDYDTFIQDIGREFHTAGECTTLAHFDDLLGTWSSEEILNPDQVIVHRSLFEKNETVLLDVTDLVEGLREHNDNDSDGMRLQKRHEYEMLSKYYPELIEAATRGEGLKLSDALVSRMVNKTSYWDQRGTPHMLRSFRTLMMEESLNAAQDAVADRLYSPFILATMGIQNIDGGGSPWVPSPEEIDAVRDDMQAALSADFRLMVHHFGLDVKSVFGRESVPRLDNDYNRVDEKLLQAWGIGKSLISGGSGGPYASSALNREFVTQMMSSFQKYVERHMRKRMEVVAEAQGHYDYELKGGQRRLLEQEIVVEDEETGERRIQTVPKLLIPEVKFSTLNLRDEAQERQFMQSLKGMGLPISDQSLAVNIPIDFDEELEKSSEETVKKYVAQSQAAVKAGKILAEAGLPLPPELQGFLMGAAGGPPGEGGPAGGGPAGGDPAGEGPSGEGGGPEGGEPNVQELPRNQSRPPESDEKRMDMPKSSLKTGPSSTGYRLRTDLKTVAAMVLSGSAIVLDDLLDDEETLNLLGLEAYTDEILQDRDVLRDYLVNDVPVEEVESGLREVYRELLGAIRDYESNYGGEIQW